MKIEQHISVRALVEHILRRGDLVYAFSLGDRAFSTAGIRIQQKLLAERPDDVDWEVPVSGSTESQHISLQIHGRIDGLYTEENRVIVEEVKSTGRDLDHFISENEDLHWGQVKIYAAIHAQDRGLTEVSARLTYCQLETGEIRSVTRDFSQGDLEAFFREITGLYLEWAEKLEEWRRKRNQAIAKADFPFQRFREGQRQMALDVYHTIKSESQLIMQAPTGTGKTVAVLFPSIKSMTEGLTDKIFYLTARTTGKMIARETLKEMAKTGMRLKSVILTAKDKICFNPDKNCTGEECDYAGGFYDRLPEAREILFRQDLFDSTAIRDIARIHRICPFELALELTLWADCIICDLNYAFAPGVYLKRFFQDVQENYTFLVDEAHNLVDRAREMFSARLKKSSFLLIRRMIKNRELQIYKTAGRINSILREMKKKLGAQNRFTWEKERPEKLLSLLKEFNRDVERWYKKNAGSAAAKGVLDIYFEVARFLRTAENFDENYATGKELSGRDIQLYLFCIDPAEQMRQALERARSVIFYSATMAPVEYFARLLGCRRDLKKRILPSPFPEENLQVLVADGISTIYREREATAESVVEAVGAWANTKNGNFMAFFPSYEYLEMIFPLYAQTYPHHEILIQSPGMTEEEKNDFLAEFSHENSGTLMGFVVMGGIFGEGIDLAGDRLSGAAIVGVGLPGITAERELIRTHFENKDGSGFPTAYLYPGMNRVLQAAGRVIRSETDRGSVLLIDRRFSQLQYRRLLPKEWRIRRAASLDPLLRLQEEFWKGGKT